MIRLPLYVPGRLRRRTSPPPPGPPAPLDPPPARPRPEPAAAPRGQEATDTPYPEPGQPPAGPLWLAAEAAVLARLAEHGGDLTAHRTVHLENP